MDTASESDESHPAAYSLSEIPALTKALQNGDEAAFLWLHTQWGERIFRYALAVAGGDGALASEAAQATWLRVARHIRVLPDESALWNWIARAVRNASTDLRRKNGRYRRALERFAEWCRPSASRAPDDYEASLLAALDSAIERLSTSDRSLLEARYFDREPLSLIGTRLGLTTRAVEGRLARLRERLRASMGEELRRQTP